MVYWLLWMDIWFSINFFLDIREHVRHIEKGVATKEPRFIYRAIRALVTVRRKLNPNVLRKALLGYHPASSTVKDPLIAYLGEVGNHLYIYIYFRSTYILNYWLLIKKINLITLAVNKKVGKVVINIGFRRWRLIITQFSVQGLASSPTSHFFLRRMPICTCSYSSSC